MPHEWTACSTGSGASRSSSRNSFRNDASPDGTRLQFAQLLADRERMAEAEENLRVYVGGKPEYVAPLKRRKR
jgi:hypothetical protein